VAPALFCRARRVPGNPRLAPVETPPTIHDPIALVALLPGRSPRRLACPARTRRQAAPGCAAAITGPPAAARPDPAGPGDLLRDRPGSCARAAG
jgi:hypothetical protein